jgi:hypothetical protein
LAIFKRASFLLLSQENKNPAKSKREAKMNNEILDLLDSSERLASWLRESIKYNTLCLDFKWAAEDFLRDLEKVKKNAKI